MSAAEAGAGQDRPIHLGILSRGPNLYSTKRLVEAAEERDVRVEVFDTLHCVVNLSKRRPEVHCAGKKITGIDAIIPRIGASITFYGLAVLRQFEMMGVFPANESQAIARSRDKLRSLQLFSRLDIGIPPTAFARSIDDVRQGVRQVGGVPVILKLLEGTQGMGVILAETMKSAESVLDAMHSLKQNILIQKFIAEAQGIDYRAIVIDGKVVAAMERRASEGEFRSNVHRGGSTRAITLEPEYERTALEAAACLGLNIAGVDMMPSDDGPMVLEVNSSPGLQGIEGATGLDVAGDMIDFCIAHAQSGDTRDRAKG